METNSCARQKCLLAVCYGKRDLLSPVCFMCLMSSVGFLEAEPETGHVVCWGRLLRETGKEGRDARYNGEKPGEDVGAAGV